MGKKQQQPIYYAQPTMVKQQQYQQPQLQPQPQLQTDNSQGKITKATISSMQS